MRHNISELIAQLNWKTLRCFVKTGATILVSVQQDLLMLPLASVYLLSLPEICYVVIASILINQNRKTKKWLVKMSNRTKPDTSFLCPTSLHSHKLNFPFPSPPFPHSPVSFHVSSSSLLSIPSQPLQTKKRKTVFQKHMKYC
jgi:hypothetical protein